MKSPAVIVSSYNQLIIGDLNNDQMKKLSESNKALLVLAMKYAYFNYSLISLNNFFHGLFSDTTSASFYLVKNI